MTDENCVIERVLGGEREAFRLLVVRYQRQVCTIVRNIIPDTHEWEDLAQEVFLTAYTKLASFDVTRASFLTWLLTIARNRCFNELKRIRQRRSEFLVDTADAACATDFLSQDEWNCALDRSLEGLPPEQKTVFVLAEIQELKLAEIARIEGVKIGTVKSRLSRAKEKLRLLMQPFVEFPHATRRSV